MFNQKLLTFITLALLVATILVSGSSPVNAQGGGQNNGNNKGKITPKDRQAAAAASGLTLEAMAATTQIIDPNTGMPVPRYFSHPNYANSPLRMPNAPLVEFVGDGTGAAASATVDPLTGAITAITLDAGGSGYSVAPDVVFSGGSGAGAAATATISGTVSSLTLNSGGSGYTGPTVAVEINGDGTGAVATATLEFSGIVSAVNVTNPGSGYTTATVTIDGDGAGATAEATLSGSVTNITNLVGGSGYTAPVVDITGDGTGALASATVTPVGFVTDITVDNPGSGYTAATVTIDGNGTGATAEATLSGSVTAINLVNGGSLYTAPVVEITGDGTGAAAEATVTPLGFVDQIIVDQGGKYKTAPLVTITGDGAGATAVATLNAGGVISAITVTNGGSGYTFADVTIKGGAKAHAIVDTTRGPITAINLTNGGSGYTTAAVNITDATGLGASADVVVTMGVSAIMVTNGGSGYTNATVNIVGDGSGAAATANLDTTSGPITAIVIDNGGSGYTTAAVNITDATGSGASAEALVTARVSAITVTNGGSGYTTATVTISGDGAGATADAVLDTSGFVTGLTLVSGGSGYTSPPVVSFIDAGGTGSGAVATATTSGSVSAVTLVSGGSGYVTPGLRKFVDGLAGLGSGNANNLGQYIPVAVPDTTTYSTANGYSVDADYYEIALVEYTEQMHSDLPPTRLRGYVQLETPVVQGSHYDLGNGYFSVDPPHYLGSTIVTPKNRPVRILFRNLLPTGEGGNLFIPVDSTVMGSGLTATGHQWTMDPANQDQIDPLNPLCSDVDKFTHGKVQDGRCYPDNRATVHLHGGISPWISDGTPHQWITPSGESTAYPQGVSVKPVPDMSGCDAANDGCMTFYYTNQQSARLTFYHDHAWGITRLNVYAGEAAPYVITDDTEQALVNAGLIPGPLAAETIPLVVQDKTFVPSNAQLAWQDETWNTANWGGEGSLWIPHVYSPAQNPGDPSGVNQFGRWAYGPWFWPPTSNIEYGPIANDYYDPACNPDVAGWCEPPLMPGTPYISMGMESFNDTPVINGTVYPTLTVEPKAYRFRILNAANDRFFSLSLYKAVDANGVACDANNPNPAPEFTGVACTEVALNPAEVAAALLDPAGVFPTPGPDVNAVNTKGPSWIDIATEGGFLPAPVVVPPRPTTWVVDPTVFNAGNVDQHGLLIGPAERHDVIIDFSQYAGQTLILYNDAPAAFPARDPRYDYYTGNADLRDTGGAPPTLPGYGPNIRTIMQIKVNTGTPQPFDLAALQNAFKSTSQGGMGVFETGQNPIVVGQQAYNSAYGTSFTGSEGLAQIYDTSLNFRTLATTTVAGPPYTTSSAMSIPLKPKMIQDEMGEAFELEYGRMSGFLGVETPNAQAGQQNMILHPYTYPPDEIIRGVEVGGTDTTLDITPLAWADDGTQIWKITHNGVDTHPIHWHLYDVQLINRVGWDGIIRKPEATELGWKDTIRVSPLEDTIVAIRPIIPHIPTSTDPANPWFGGLPNSIRLLDPAMPEGAYLRGANTTQREALGLPLLAFNPDGEPVDIVNHYVNFGWEYVYHCHILSHEEMDMMHAQVVGVAPEAPSGLAWTLTGNGQSLANALTWNDNSRNETAFVIERSVNGGPYSVLATVSSNGPGTGPATWSDVIGPTQDTYDYQVYAINVVGDTWDYSDPAFNEIPAGGGWPTLTLSSGGVSLPPTNTIATPTNLTASVDPTTQKRRTIVVNLAWTDNANNETGYLIQRADDAAFAFGVTNATVGGNVTNFSQTVARGKTYYYRVLAFNDTIQSGWSNTTSVTTP